MYDKITFARNIEVIANFEGNHNKYYVTISLNDGTQSFVALAGSFANEGFQEYLYTNKSEIEINSLSKKLKSEKIKNLGNKDGYSVTRAKKRKGYSDIDINTFINKVSSKSLLKRMEELISESETTIPKAIKEKKEAIKKEKEAEKLKVVRKTVKETPKLEQIKTQTNVEFIF